MKKVIIITQSPRMNDMLHSTITGHYMSKHEIFDPTEALEIAGIKIERYVSNAELRAKYPDGLSEDAIVILDPQLVDGSSEMIFDLFGEKLKKHTIIFATDGAFGLEAITKSFEHASTKDGKITSYLDVVNMVIQRLEA